MKTSLLFAPLLWASLALPALADKIPLTELSRYLNGLKTGQAAFTQINSDGTISTGVLSIKRPGRVRFEYNPPDNALVLAGGQQLAIFDGKSNTGPEQYPLKRTPLSIILARNVNLSQAKMVVAHTGDATSTTVRAQDPENPDYGSIDLIFTANPIELRKWVINDSSGGSTTVVLSDLKTGMHFGSAMFNITVEAEKRGLD